jgi:uncharacterized coiled-coil protein SlyX
MDKTTRLYIKGVEDRAAAGLKDLEARMVAKIAELETHIEKQNDFIQRLLAIVAKTDS